MVIILSFLTLASFELMVLHDTTGYIVIHEDLADSSKSGRVPSDVKIIFDSFELIPSQQQTGADSADDTSSFFPRTISRLDLPKVHLAFLTSCRSVCRSSAVGDCDCWLPICVTHSRFLILLPWGVFSFSKVAERI
jgi:hypothetical protein